MTNIYEDFDRAFAKVAAFGLILDGENVGRIAFKHGGAVTAYVQIWGIEMTKGRAGGGGYDRSTAAFHNALAKIDTKDATPSKLALRALDRLRGSLGDEGRTWKNALESAGFTVASVIA